MQSLVAGWRIGSMAMLVVAFASSCSGTHTVKDRGPARGGGAESSAGQGGAESGAGEGGGESGGGAVSGAEEPPRVASNSVPIPGFDTVTPEPCGAFDVEIAQCSSGQSGQCKSASCSCEDRVISYSGACIEGRCLTSISCAAACAAAASSNAPYQVDVLCAYHGTCVQDADCDNGRCVRAPGQERGACWPDTYCYEDADCAEGACVVRADHSATCADGSIGAACNLDAQCASPGRCLLEDGAFAGLCSDGAENAPCLADGDCEASHQCVTLADSSRVCSRQVVGSPCGSAEDCSSGYCVEGQCSAGESGSPCVLDSDCESQSHCVDLVVERVCSDGKEGSACTGKVGDCTAGLYCSPRETCASGVAGDTCYYDGDCLNEKCARGTCTDGKLGQACSGIWQCEEGLRCISDIVCASGADGDPCSEDQDCSSGVCGDRADVDEAEQAACLNYGGIDACGEGAVCLSGICLRQFCLGSGSGN